MKGFLVKDIRVIWHSSRIFLIMLVVMLLAARQAERYSFIIGYVTMIGFLLAITTVSYDEQDKSIVYLMTLPAGRKVYVLEKYVLMFGCGLLGAAVSSLFCMALYRGIAMQILKETVLIYVLMALVQLIMMPLQLKFGGEKGRMVLIALLAVAMVVITSLDDVLRFFFGSYEAGISTLKGLAQGILAQPPVVIALTVLTVCFICLAVSYLISRKTVENREF
ncbi:MAG: ABC-2 transporter permease [Roseburia sp.]|nr:ABC-2 transporter permease [Roseburia sp.]MCM1241197.1 ABC-2 transporter permease [Roseburia sp.]